MNEETILNDYDRIAKEIENIGSIIYGMKQILSAEEQLTSSAIVAIPVLEEEGRRLSNLRQWVNGLAITHRNMRA